MYSQSSDNLYEGPKRKKRCFPGQWSNQKVNHSQWHPDDDYILINSILHLMNISHVYYCVKFSKPYQEKDIERRWKELLYNESRSKLALEAIRNISVYDKDVLDRKIPFNEAENRKLNSIFFEDVYQNDACFPPFMEPFQKILKEDNCNTFYKNRTPCQLFKAWKVLRKHLNETVKLGGNPNKYEDIDMLIRCMQNSGGGTASCNNSASTGISASVQLQPSEISSDYRSFQRLFSQMQSKVTYLDTPLLSNVSGGGSAGISSSKISIPTRPVSTRSSSVEDQQLINEISESDKDNRRYLYRKLRMVGEEAKRWTCLVEAVTQRPIIDRQSKNSRATLTGMRLRFLIKEKEATFGRKTLTVKPDIDLSLEDPAARISRLQGCIKLLDSGEFVLVNWAEEPIFIDGAVVLTDEELTLRNDSMITISGLTFRFNYNKVDTYTENDLPHQVRYRSLDDNDSKDDGTESDGLIIGASSTTLMRTSGIDNRYNQYSSIAGSKLIGCLSNSIDGGNYSSNVGWSRNSAFTVGSSGTVSGGPSVISSVGTTVNTSDQPRRKQILK